MPEEAAQAIDQVDAARIRGNAERGFGWAYVGDEMYFIAGRELPARDYYDDGSLTENGVGAVRDLFERFESGIASVPALTGRRIAIATGTRMAEVLRPLADRLAAASGAHVEVIAVANRMYGSTVNCAGLLPGADILAAVRGAGAFDAVLHTAEALNDDALFIDGMAFTQLEQGLAPARVIPAHDLIAAVTTL